MRLRDVVIGANASIFYRLDFSKIKDVFYPHTEEEAEQAIRFARERSLRITVKGGGSGLSGACTGGNDERIVISTLWLNKILRIDPQGGYIDVQPGLTPDLINEALKPYGMKFYVAPSSRDVATVGGILSTDGGGNDTWVNGTMRDNTLRVRMILYDGRKITVTREGVESEDEELAEELNRLRVTLDDVASSHGTLGFVTELRLQIRPLSEESVVGGVAHFDDATQLGQAIHRMIEARSPIKYGEAIVAAHPDVREDLRPPLITLQFPGDYADDLREILDIELLPDEQVDRMKDIRIKLPKRNPKQGIQLALFEGYGLHGRSLLNMQATVDAINELLESHRYTPFAKYGHAPSKWYLGDNTAAYGMVMHSREIRPEHTTREEVLNTILDIVDLCEKLGVTPKPEHKWPFSDTVKLNRLREIRRVVGGGFNDFLLRDDYREVLRSMV